MVRTTQTGGCIRHRCVDVARVLTCDLKADDGVLILVDLAGAPTLDVGGSALAQALGQLGRDAPESDVEATARAGQG